MLSWVEGVNVLRGQCADVCLVFEFTMPFDLWEVAKVTVSVEIRGICETDEASGLCTSKQEQRRSKLPLLSQAKAQYQRSYTI